jgi:hypothetical protein
MSQTYEHLLAEKNLLDQAQQGNAEAIATLLNRSLNPKGITAMARLEQNTLHILIEAIPAPTPDLAPFVHQGVASLGITAANTVKIYGRQRGISQLGWQQAFNLATTSGLGGVSTVMQATQTGNGLPVTEFELGAGGQQVIAGDRRLQMTPHGAVVTLLPQPMAPALRSRTLPSPEAACPPMPYLVGREKELDGAIAALERSLPVEFYGESGLGKSALARALAHQPSVIGLGLDGLVYRIVGEQPAEDVYQSLFETFFETEEGIPHRLSEEEVQYALRQKKALVVLDDVRLPPNVLERMTRNLPALSLIATAPERNLWNDSFSMPLSGLPQAEAVNLLERYLNDPLTPEQRPSAELLCTLLYGHPQRILQAAMLMRERHLSLLAMVEQLQSGATLEVLALRACATFSDAERRCLAALAVLGEVPVQTHHLAGLTGTPNPQPIVANLVSRGFLSSDGVRHTLAGNLLAPLRQFWNLGQWVQPVVRHFLHWVQQQAPIKGALLPDLPLLTRVVSLAAEEEQWKEVVQFARLMDGPLAMGCRWGAWEQVWDAGLRAAEHLGNAQAIALANHQLGTRALCVGDTFAAINYLTQALRLREAGGNETAAAASRHNLSLLVAPMQHLQPQPQRPPQYQPPPQSPAPQYPSQVIQPPQSPLPQPPQYQPPEPRPQPPPLPAQPAPAPHPPYQPPPPMPGTSDPEAEAASSRFSPLLVGGLVASLLLGVLAAWLMVRDRPSFSVNPSSLAFSNQTIHTSSQPQTVTLQNTGSQALRLGRITPVGANPTDFQVSEQCTRAPLPPAQSCTIQVTFTPQGQGDRIADLAFNDITGVTRYTIPLRGNSPTTIGGNSPSPGNPSPTPPVNPDAALRFNPGTLDFGEWQVNSQTGQRTIALVNNSAVPVTIQLVRADGQARSDFLVSEQCTGGPLAPGQSCPIFVAFRPTAPGQRTANINVIDTSNRPWNVPLTGYGMDSTSQQPSLSITPGRVDFGAVTVRNTSREERFFLQNASSVPVQIRNISIESRTGDFRLTRNTCPSELPVNARCEVGVVFSPEAQGDRRAALRFDTSDYRGTARSTLMGQGVPPAVPALRVSPPSLDFGSIELERASAPRAVTIGNMGTAPLLLGDIRVNGNQDFVSDRNSPIGAECSNVSLRPGQSCGFNVVFIPQVEGPRNANIVIPTNTGSTTVALRGSGSVQRFPTLSIQPTSLDFDNQTIGNMSAPRSVTLRNSGNAPLILGNLALSGEHPFDFATSNDSSFAISCTNVTLSPGEVCTVQVMFNPTEPGYRNAQLVIPSNAPNSPSRVRVGGVGVAAITPRPEPIPDPQPEQPIQPLPAPLPAPRPLNPLSR